ncbi:MAG: methyltransferase domain-containing protein [Deltaproteobacteria bacterium]|nr:methyltransferase domain-containing protein [Deltaproteobacteria bacterium]
MSEEFWWKHCGFFYKAAKRCELVQNVHRGFFEALDRLNLPPGIKVLDAGCGTGNSTFPLAERGFNVLAIDFGLSVINQARALNLKKYHFTRIRFGLMDLSRNLPIKDNAFDLVASLHCIMKVKNVDLTLKEFYRILKPGGRAVISTTPDSYTIPQWLMLYAAEHGWLKTFWDIRWLIAWAIPYFVFTSRSERRNEHRWDEKEFSLRMENAGFRTLHMKREPYINVGCLIGVFEKPGKTPGA